MDSDDELPYIPSYELDIKKLLSKIIQNIFDKEQSVILNGKLSKGEDKLKSICPHLEFLEYNCDKIKFNFKPNSLYPLVIHPSIQYTLSFSRRTYGWVISNFSVPLKIKLYILRIFQQPITEDMLIAIIIPKTYEKLCLLSTKFNEMSLHKLESFSHINDNIWFHDLEEEMLLTVEQRNEIRENRNQILQRMISSEPSL